MLYEYESPSNNCKSIWVLLLKFNSGLVLNLVTRVNAELSLMLTLLICVVELVLALNVEWG